ncbi:MAG: voltage-gated potassium channel protein [Nocardioides sp.]|nr:voltage-gated potassium channel protein [Nocardioides sp.]
MSTVRPLATLVGVLLVYFAVPVDWTTSAPFSSVLITVLGAVVLGWALTSQIVHHVRGDAPVGVPSVAMLLLLAVVVFALGYVALETARPGEFHDLSTRVDSLYFTLQVLTTVGLGDVHAQGQTARALVSVQMVFDVVFVASSLAVMSGRLRTRLTGPAPSAGGDA